MKKYLLIVFSRQQYATNTYECEAANAKEAAAKWEEVLKAEWRTNQTEEDLEEGQSMEDFLDDMFDAEEMELVAAIAADADMEMGGF